MSDLSLSRRAMAAGYQTGPGLDDGALLWIRICDGTVDRDRRAPGHLIDARDVLGPDLDDDATLGCLVGQVRDAAGGRRCTISWPTPAEEPGGPWPAEVSVWIPARGCLRAFTAPTLAEALVCALEAHHGR